MFAYAAGELMILILNLASLKRFGFFVALKLVIYDQNRIVKGCGS